YAAPELELLGSGHRPTELTNDVLQRVARSTVGVTGAGALELELEFRENGEQWSGNHEVGSALDTAQGRLRRMSDLGVTGPGGAGSGRHRALREGVELDGHGRFG